MSKKKNITNHLKIAWDSDGGIFNSSMQPLLRRQVCGVSLPSSAVSWLRRLSVHGFLKVLQVDMGLV
jgi:hypothetical protein